jgi:hypothetical protein
LRNERVLNTKATKGLEEKQGEEEREELRIDDC